MYIRGLAAWFCARDDLERVDADAVQEGHCASLQTAQTLCWWGQRGRLGPKVVRPDAVESRITAMREDSAGVERVHGSFLIARRGV